MKKLIFFAFVFVLFFTACKKQQKKIPAMLGAIVIEKRCEEAPLCLLKVQREGLGNAEVWFGDDAPITWILAEKGDSLLVPEDLLWYR